MAAPKPTDRQIATADMKLAPFAGRLLLGALLFGAVPLLIFGGLGYRKSKGAGLRRGAALGFVIPFLAFTAAGFVVRARAQKAVERYALRRLKSSRQSSTKKRMLAAMNSQVAVK